MVQKDRLNCVCGTELKKAGVATSAEECVCTIVPRAGKEKDVGFPFEINIVKDSDEPKRQRRKRGPRAGDVLKKGSRQVFSIDGRSKSNAK